MRAQILVGDCRESMRTLPDQSVHTCVTSPPYFGLRDYGTAKWEGGDAACDHRAPSRFDYALNSGLGPTGAQDQASNAGSGSVQQFRGTCDKCGATRVDEQIGLEPTPDEFVAALVEVFRDVRRVLRDDGTVWLNLGDSYAGSGKGRNADGSHQEGGKQGTSRGTIEGALVKTNAPDCKPKDLIGIPWRVAFALQADGWYLRQDIIWHKPNPMPESVRDRCTKAHEYIFLLSKQPKYYYDHYVVQEKAVAPPKPCGPKNDLSRNDSDRTGIVRGDGVTRNRRSVWTVSTKPFKGAHFATFPPDLIEPCILAGCPEGGTVLDPFGGAGTTGLVANRNGRNAILCELNPEYAEMAEQRIAGRAPKQMVIA